MSEKKWHIQSTSSDAIFWSLKETFVLWTKEITKTVWNLFHADKAEEGLQKNQISHALDKREKELQKSRIF